MTYPFRGAGYSFCCRQPISTSLGGGACPSHLRIGPRDADRAVFPVDAQALAMLETLRPEFQQTGRKGFAGYDALRATACIVTAASPALRSRRQTCTPAGPEPSQTETFPNRQAPSSVSDPRRRDGEGCRRRTASPTAVGGVCGRTRLGVGACPSCRRPYSLATGRPAQCAPASDLRRAPIPPQRERQE